MYGNWQCAACFVNLSLYSGCFVNWSLYIGLTMNGKLLFIYLFLSFLRDTNKNINKQPKYKTLLKI
jgi:hypothetical protein